MILFHDRASQADVMFTEESLFMQQILDHVSLIFSDTALLTAHFQPLFNVKTEILGKRNMINVQDEPDMGTTCFTSLRDEWGVL